MISYRENRYIYHVSTSTLNQVIEFNKRSIQEAVAKIKKEYGHISEENLNKAISNALNRSAQQSKTAAGREIRKKYNISTNKVNEAMKVRYSQPRTLEARVVASGSPLSLSDFQAKQVGERATTSFDRKGRASSRLNRKSRTNAVKGVSAVIKKGETIVLPTAFIQVANGGITVFARGKYKSKGDGFEFAKARLPIGKLTTTSIPLMFANDEVIQPVGRNAEDFFSKRIDHEISYILSK